MIKMNQLSQKLVVLFLLVILIVGCTKPQIINKNDYLDIYKVAFKTIFDQDANFYNNSKMTYVLVKTDNLELNTDEKIALLNYVKEITKVDVGEGKYSNIETNLAKNIFGGMAIELENIVFKKDGKVILTSRKTFLGSIQLRQTIEKNDDVWMTSNKDKIVKSK
ncbi:hypothetical protein [Paenibacillus qinlingensis]|uniref:Lipoprotein n=1 Tax=Paenibacillus qinlingensis TaxID=1837343 RepID=A0ABU1P1G2_9BACL|nr:hypothetical protein [Paenibacillus qinlingensis]MDR6553161.1 hypothetical protein [Paenibacillus qinlingensis]